MRMTGLETADDHARSVQDNHARVKLRDDKRDEWIEPVALSFARDEALLAIAAAVEHLAVAIENATGGPPG